jgi:hypothetical protein
VHIRTYHSQGVKPSLVLLVRLLAKRLARAPGRSDRAVPGRRFDAAVPGPRRTAIIISGPTGGR